MASLICRMWEVKILREIMVQSVHVLTSLLFIGISVLENPYKYFFWLFSHIMRFESTSHMPSLILYILYFSLNKGTVFNWAKVISSNNYFQLYPWPQPFNKENFGRASNIVDKLIDSITQYQHQHGNEFTYQGNWYGPPPSFP